MFTRGFKSWCENVALQQRRELKLRPIDPLAPRALAQHLGVLVWGAEQVPGLDPRALSMLLKTDPDSWSAVTLSGGPKQLVILNSTHRGGRPASDLMHELAHIAIGHAPARIDVSPDGLLLLNTYDAQQEREATWLAGALLLPRPALMHIHKSGMTAVAAMQMYGVSRQMFDYRLRMTGVDLQLRRALGAR
jgi:hypothetical protein